MPFYHALVRPGSTTEDQRRRFAGDVVTVHCDVTGAPPSFVHALITDSPEPFPEGTNAVVNGTIRAGRTDAQKAEIHARLSEALAAVIGVDVSTVHTTTRDIRASFTMEGGVLLPEPGSVEEAEWGSAVSH